MYTKDQIRALDRANFDFTNFDWRSGRAMLKIYAAEINKLKQKRKGHPTGYVEGLVQQRWQARLLHVTLCLAHGRQIMDLEQPNTQIPIEPASIRRCLNSYAYEEEEAA